eukprot:CAMPEP_0176126780 /NCGR_PEP_ID=MMETSP0120_2-20121206/63999_1 /TAXON_ID=160619 /ORGANISM="Kryptoperidinium foliaceum, Strain CCMP 1326" /LENGTH=40 /DNA_ID= /DNA_START= /DNA_END= /DNA_ORIENTATION=
MACYPATGAITPFRAFTPLGEAGRTCGRFPGDARCVCNAT